MAVWTGVAVVKGRPALRRRRRALVLAMLAAGLAGAAGAAPPARQRGAPRAEPPRPETARADDAPPPRALPAEVRAALQAARLPEAAFSAVVHDLATGQVVLAHEARRALNPASLMKLPLTLAALDRLGPAYTWATPVWLAGPLRDGVLEGALHLQGRGDPKLVLERLWLLLRRVQQLGVREIRGDIVLDQSMFAPEPLAPGDFDGEPLRPYNVRPAALMVNQRAVDHAFVPDRAAGVARVLVEPPRAGVDIDRSVPLADGPCGDWRAALKARFEPQRTRFEGRYPADCGERHWPVADPDPAGHDARVLAALWREMGGTLTGSVREGPPPAGVAPSFEFDSPPLLDVVRDINKFSNNVLAQQLFFTLALHAAPGVPATDAAAREALRSWLAARGGALADEVVVDNGSGLSRSNRVSAALLARLLQQAADGPWFGELLSSLPVAGLDGTLRRARFGNGSPAVRAHLKTGSLRDVTGVAGYVLSASARRYVLVALVNHPQAAAARPAIDALVRWAMRDAPA